MLIIVAESANIFGWRTWHAGIETIYARRQNKERVGMIFRYTDGDEYYVGGPLRAEHRHDGWYVLGEGHMIPVIDRDEAERTMVEMGAYRRRA
jgi:hypothetical protein